ncbi:MAG: DUF1549 domain-containing protein [Myxococcota bacterium]
MNRTVLWSVGVGFALATVACGNGRVSPEDSAGDASDGGMDAGDDPVDDDDQSDDDGMDPPPPSGTVCDDMAFDNVIDQAACPFIQAEGIEPPEADSVEFCRRAYIDLLGESPSAVEYEADCKWLTNDEIVDDFLDRPEYVQVSQRMWGDIFHYTSSIVHHEYIADLDALVGDLYLGNIDYTSFARLAATHPAFLGRWDGNDLVGFNFMAFLGRDANPAERLALEPLWHQWEERDVVHPTQSNARHVVLNTLRCTAPNEADCYSDYWGEHTVIIAPPVPGDVDPMGPNVLDQSALTDEQWDVLRLPGQLITEHTTFYEAYVDRALRRYLGYDGGAELPTVRQALVDLMVQSGGNVRELEREILTSVLYQSSNLFDEGDVADPEQWVPPYWHGPVKQMDAEDWLRSAAKLTGVELGRCDHRYPVVQQGSAGLHPHGYPTVAGTNTPDYEFRDKAQLLGGCPDHVTQFREARTGLIAALTQATLTDELCTQADQASPIYPLQFVEDDGDKTEEALMTAANQVYSAALVRPIPEAASDALMAGVTGCRDDSDCLPSHFAAETCRLTLKAADFLFY